MGGEAASAGALRPATTEDAVGVRRPDVRDPGREPGATNALHGHPQRAVPCVWGEPHHPRIGAGWPCTILSGAGPPCAKTGWVFSRPVPHHALVRRLRRDPRHAASRTLVTWLREHQRARRRRAWRRRPRRRTRLLATVPASVTPWRVWTPGRPGRVRSPPARRGRWPLVRAVRGTTRRLPLGSRARVPSPVSVSATDKVTGGR